MDVVRNFVQVSGIASEEELAGGVMGQVIQYSEAETVFFPENKEAPGSLYQVIVHVDARPVRSVRTPTGTTVILDGTKRFKLLYEEAGYAGRAGFVTLELPYNTFFELPEGVRFTGLVRVFVLDAYFQLLNARRIYTHLVYLVKAGVEGYKADGSSLPAYEDPLVPLAVDEETVYEIEPPNAEWKDGEVYR